MQSNGLQLTLACCAAASMWAGSQLLTRLWKPASPQQQLLAAAKQGSVAGVAEALAAGAAVDCRDPANRETALIAAARGRLAGHIEVLRALLAAGACPHYTDGAGNTALHAAAACGSESHALALLEAGAGADWRNHGGQTPLELAFQHGHITVVLALLSFGADTAPLQARHGGSRWNAFCSAHAAAVQRAEFAFQCRLERQWQESAANRGGSAGSSNSSSSGSGSGGASTSRSGTGGSDGPSTSSAAWAEWPAGPHEQPDLCPICFSEAADFVLDHCGCAACFGCLRTHAATEIKQGQQPRCPLCLAAGGGAAPAAAGPADGSSSMLISRSQLEYLLDAADLLVHDRRQLEQLLSLRSCPHCGEGLELDQGVDLLTATCPHPRCGRRLHVEDAAAEQAFRRYSKQQRYRECPSCGATVERTHGCNHMKCRCNTHFCYVCGQDLTRLGLRLYSHFVGGGCRGYGCNTLAGL